MRNQLRAAAVSLLLLPGFFASIARERGLSFEERVRAQEAIERVYYSHQLEAKLPFEQAVPRSVLEAKVTRTLKQSAALEQGWKTPVTARMLHREWERIATQSRAPERLPEIYAALENDPVLIQECFVRPVLVERLARNFFQGDRLLQAGPRGRAERLREALQQGSAALGEEVLSAEFELRRTDHQGTNAPSLPSSAREMPVASTPTDANRVARDVAEEELESWRRRLPGRAGEAVSEETATSFVVRVLRESSDNLLRYTQYEIEKESWERWWSQNQRDFDPAKVREVAARELLAPRASLSNSMPVSILPSPESGPCIAGDTWDNGNLDDAPLIRSGHSAVWTGSLMLVWGGNPIAMGPSGTGARYDPLTDTWTGMSQAGAPSNRKDHSAVWTGTEMLVWGGQDAGGNPQSIGGRYNPSTDTWSPMPFGMNGRVRHTAVWTGTEMIVFGGTPGLPLGSRYNPATDSWNPIQTPGWTAKIGHSAVWTGTHMLIWSGSEGGVAIASGGAYDPAANQWSTLSSAGAPPPVQGHTAVWTGSRMIVWGGEAADKGTARNTGGVYDFATDTWLFLTSSASAPAPRAMHSAVWTGTKMIVWGGRSFAGSQETRFNSGGVYDPADFWVPTNLTNAPAAVSDPTAVWTGSRMLIAGEGAGGRYDPGADAWTSMSFGDTARPLNRPAAIWTGNLMIVWGGLTETQTVTNTGYRYDPLLDEWSPTLSASAPSARERHAAVWTGSSMILWGGRNGTTVFSDGGSYDPVADSWTPLSNTGAPSARYDATAVWTGSRMLIWGGNNTTTTFSNTGGRYNPIGDSWSAITTSGAPTPRTAHTAVWTGNEMIVWGGGIFSFTDLNTGGRYNPATDQWTSLPTSNAPSARRFHTAQWTGSKMLVWGGSSGGTVGTGSSYDPLQNLWAAMVSAGAPSPRERHAAVWTGSRMILWGGRNGNTAFPDGGSYDPVAHQWASTSLVQAPSARFGHVAVWTGTRMIVWGANLDAGRYVPETLDSDDADSDGVTECGGDCNDADSATHPGAAEVCDGLDNDCDTLKDEGFPDVDADGYPGCNDCLDVDATVHPGAPEVCNGIDDDCDTVIDDRDLDGDGFSACSDDCNDSNPAIHPGATELCNSVDDDCDAATDEGFDLDGDGFTLCGGDCNDAVASIHPGATEICNHVDEDCDGFRDEGFPDTDSDGYAACAGDCNDSDSTVFPGATETCDGVDDDCDNVVDDAPDNDGDGFNECVDCRPLDPSVHPGAEEVCNSIDDDCDTLVDERDADGDGFLACGGPDCDDGNPGVHPGAPEICNGLDDDCNLSVDDRDQDGDGANGCGDDCNDLNGAVWYAPFAVSGFDVTSAQPTVLVWDDQSFVGTETVYDLTTGFFGPASGISLAAGSCLQSGFTGTFVEDSRPGPPAGQALWYLVRARNSCGSGSYGQNSLGQERLPPTCP